MTTSQVTCRDSETFIRLGRHNAPVPGPLADATLQLISDGRSYRGVGSPPATTWLFPGHLPGRPITPARLGERPRATGIYAQTGRRAALLDLAAQLPAAVLAAPP
jgi:3-hydroxymyristoyl/3-hydroxydecanoyl-(acyl carrier protein) dehydratase